MLRACFRGRRTNTCNRLHYQHLLILLTQGHQALINVVDVFLKRVNPAELFRHCCKPAPKLPTVPTVPVLCQYL